MTSSKPAVSVVMIPHDRFGERAAFIPMVTKCLIDQTYTGPLELIVVDDSVTDSTYETEFNKLWGDIQQRMVRVIYLRYRDRISMGAKYNQAIEASSGEIIAFWPDDDWCHPDRLRLQVEALENSTKPAHAIGDLYLVNIMDGSWWLFEGKKNSQFMDCGLIVKRAFCEDRAFPEKHAPESDWLEGRTDQVGVLYDRPDLFVQVKHAYNVSAHPHAGWKSMRRLSFAPLFKIHPEALRAIGHVAEEHKQLLCHPYKKREAFFVLQGFSEDEEEKNALLDEEKATEIGRRIVEQTSLSARELNETPLVILLPRPARAWRYNGDGTVEPYPLEGPDPRD